MTKFADLHIHTHYSDSTYSPQEVVKEATQNGLCCISITDHDAIDGIKPTQSAAQEFSLEVISGIELSCECEGKDVHMLGYCVNVENLFFKGELTKMQTVRVNRIREMVEKLKKQGINNIEANEVLSLTRSNSVGRMHLAMILKQKKWVSTISEAFQKYIGESSLAYVPKLKQTPYEAILLIQKAGGVAVLAHPQITNRDELIPGLAEAGLKGLEVYYSTHSQTTIKRYQDIAKKHKLIMTGGSDSHGKARESTFIGKSRIPYETVQELKALSRNG